MHKYFVYWDFRQHLQHKKHFTTFPGRVPPPPGARLRQTVSVYSELKMHLMSVDMQWCWRGLQTMNFSYKSQSRPKLWECRKSQPEFFLGVRTPTTPTVNAPLSKYMKEIESRILAWFSSMPPPGFKRDV